MESSSSMHESASSGLQPGKLYIATVKDNNDPKKLGRIKAKVDGLFDDLKDDDLPWAISKFSHFDGAGAKSGIMVIPKKGNKVLLTFQGGSPSHPMYEGYIIDEKTKLEEAETSYPDRAVFRFESGFMVVIDTKTNELFIRNPGAIHAIIDGSVDLTILGNLVTRVKGNSDHIVNGNENLRVQGNKFDIVKGNRADMIAGSGDRFVKGDDSYNVTGNHTRSAARVSDNPGAGPKPAPAEPTHPPVYEWPGIKRDSLPKTLWQILKFW